MKISTIGCKPWDGSGELYVKVQNQGAKSRKQWLAYVQYNLPPRVYAAVNGTCVIVAVISSCKSSKAARYHAKKYIEVLTFEHKLKQIEVNCGPA